MLHKFHQTASEIHTGFSTLIILILLLLIHTLGYSDTYIRINQVGYKPHDVKSAVVMSTESLSNKSFDLLNVDNEVVYQGAASDDRESYLAFPHHYILDFSSVEGKGVYRLRIDRTKSPFFRIGDTVYRAIPDSLLRFFRVQRCGDTDPLYHKPCHLLDACRIIDLSGGSFPVDLTGGWHDAGNYVKFLITASHSVYLMLLTYEMNSDFFTDADLNGYPDLLDEARIGLDWMMKMHLAPATLITQVQDLRDHSTGWRMPEDDPLTGDRPAYHRPSRSQCGSFSAAMALASQVYGEIGDDEYAVKCLKHALDVYNLSKSDIPENSTGPDSMYGDPDSWDNLALAGVELFKTTGDSTYLTEAIEKTREQPPVYWFSWGDIGGLAYARLAPHDPSCLERLEISLKHFKSAVNKNPFNYPLDYFPWGSASVQTGIAALAILHHSLTESTEYLPLAISQRDYVLGKNSHGISLIGGFGNDYPRNFHHQIPYLTGIPLPGAFAEGMVNRNEYKSTKITRETVDRFKAFQTDQAVYYDERLDYLCNEPTIGANAQALFVFTWFAANDYIP